MRAASIRARGYAIRGWSTRANDEALDLTENDVLTLLAQGKERVSRGPLGVVFSIM